MEEPLVTEHKCSINITLLSVATKDQSNLVDVLEKDFFKRHKELLKKYCPDYSVEKDDNKLYEPINYYIFGNYDLAMISLIDNYSFSQKLLIPKIPESNNENGYSIPNYSYQIITGILNEKSKNDIFTFHGKYNFISISNFKLNNKFLVKDGVVFTSRVAEKIIEKLESLKKKTDFAYMILHSFSWFEISVLIFVNNPNILSEVIDELRALKVRDLGIETNISCSNGEVHNFHKSDVFSDSLSYFGVKYNYFDDTNHANKENVDLETQIEWQVKPGHFDDFYTLLTSQQSPVKDIFKTKEPRLLLGKSDYFFLEDSPSDFNNNSLLHDFFLQNKSEVFKHIKNINTRVYLKSKVPTNYVANPEYNARTFSSFIAHKIDLTSIDLALKKLKISRQTREMTLKIIHMYLNGINDEILAIYFLDFFNYVNALINNIKEYEKLWSNYNTTVDIEDASLESLNDFEDFLHALVSQLDEGIKLRMLNSYRYEDITELNLDFNSSIQQLISMYNSLANQFGNLIYKKETAYIVLLNYKSTVSSSLVINYNVYDLIHPEFIFFSLSKEILNSIYEYIPDEFKSEIKKIKESVAVITKDNAQPYYSYLTNLLEMEIIDVDYLLNDAIRFVVTCNLDAKMFVYWTWATILKNSSAYDISGTVSKKVFESTLFRLMFTLKLYDFELDEYLYCPILELENNWNTVYPVMQSEVLQIFSDRKSKIKTEIVVPIAKLSNDILGMIYNPMYPDKVVGQNQEEIYDLMIRLRNIYSNADTSSIINRFSFLKSTESVVNDIIGENINKKIEYKMYDYLRMIQNRNHADGQYINYLHRDWKDGTPLKLFNKFDDSIPISTFYKIDQTGGVFFVSKEKAEEYFSIRNSLLIEIWNIGMKCKWNQTFNKPQIKDGE